MTDNFEDHEHQETVHPEEQATGARSNLAEAWRTKPLFKLLAVMVVAGAAVAAGTAIFSGGKQEQMSRLINPPEVHEAPGGKSSPYFLQQTKEAEAQRTKEALATGQSAMPTPIGQPTDINVTDKADPMNELRVETEHLKQQISQMQLQQTQQAAKETAKEAAPPVKQAPEQFDQTLSQAMQNQLRQLMDSWAPHGIKDQDFTKVADIQGLGNNGQHGGSQMYGADGQGLLVAGTASGNGVNTDAPKIVPVKPVVAAGTINYGQLLTEANSDLPLPILALIASGPLAGAKAVGDFQVASGYGDYLVMHFKTATLKGKDYKIDAYAIDPDTTLGGMATETDQRYLTRLILPAAASFLQGVGTALGTVPSETTTNGTSTIISQGSVGVKQGLYQGLGQAASTASSFFQEQANKVKPLVRVAANTPIGLFFTTSVCQWNMCGSTGNGLSDEATGTVPKDQPQQPPGGYPIGYNPYLAGLAGAQGYGAGQQQQSPSTAAQSSVPYPNYAGPSSLGRSYGGGGYGGGGYGGYGGYPGYR
ncbi:MAG: hypothetical protein M3N08_00150 [Pseudomonadota bacterium]|nr:hypothetical protein [Pseudomonadota bacterium]